MSPANLSTIKCAEIRRVTRAPQKPFGRERALYLFSMAPRFSHHLLLALALFSVAARGEYRASGIAEAQGLTAVTPEKPNAISPEVMAAVVAKVKANPALTQALIQANPRFKKILGIQDGAASAPVAIAPAANAEPVEATIATGYAGIPRQLESNQPPSAEKIRLAETLSQVRSIMAGGGRVADYATAERELASLPSQDSDLGAPQPAAPLEFEAQPARGSSGRLLGSLGRAGERREVAAQSLEFRKKSLLAKERRFAKYTNSSGGASLQASLEFNRRVRGAVAAPGDNYQLAMRDISEYGGDDQVPVLKPKRVIRDGDVYDTRPVGGRKYNPLLRHTYEPLMVTEKGGQNGGGGGGYGRDGRHSFNSSVVKDGPSGQATPPGEDPLSAGIQPFRR